MILLFTQSDCPACEAKKAELDRQGIVYREMPGDKIGKLGITAVDVEALAAYAMEECLPVMVELTTTDSATIEQMFKDNKERQ